MSSFSRPSCFAEEYWTLTGRDALGLDRSEDRDYVVFTNLWASKNLHACAVGFPKDQNMKNAVDILVPNDVGYTTTKPWQLVLHHIEHDLDRVFRVQKGILINRAHRSVMSDSVAQRPVQIVGIRMSGKWGICTS